MQVSTDYYIEPIMYEYASAWGLVQQSSSGGNEEGWTKGGGNIILLRKIFEKKLLLPPGIRAKRQINTLKNGGK